MWDALGEICCMENRGMHEVCTHAAAAAAAARRPGGFTSSLRVFIMSYFRGASRGGSNKAPAVSSAEILNFRRRATGRLTLRVPGRGEAASHAER